MKKLSLLLVSILCLGVLNAGAQGFIVKGGWNYSKSDVKDIKDGPGFWGVRAGYAYNSFFGPLAANLFWSSFTHRVGFYLSLGYNF